MEIVLYSVIALGLLGLVLAAVLYVVAQKFKVQEDPRIDEIAAVPTAAAAATLDAAVWQVPLCRLPTFRD